LHNDHFYGNQVFKEAETITSKENVLITVPKWKQDIDNSYTWAKDTIENTRMLLNSESKYEREYAKIFIGYLQGIIDVAPVLQYTPNDVTFDDHMRLEGSNRSVKIIEYREGHSESDCVLLLPDDGIVFTGDLCTVGFHPCLDLGDPLNTLKILDEMKKLGADVVVPGHGLIGDASTFDNTKEYIITLLNLVQEVITRSGSLEDAESIPVPEKYQEYQMRDFFYKRNLRKLYNVITE
jgi:glyoxylase-like metal-dependent hydrolase (beta-lactamase superfamily II)